jgi:hypothetical protein
MGKQTSANELWFYDPRDPLSSLLRHRDEIADLICEHRNTTYFPTITVVPGENFPRYEPEYVVPANLADAMRQANEEIARATRELRERYYRAHRDEHLHFASAQGNSTK